MKFLTHIAPLRNLTVALIVFRVVGISAFADQNNPCNPGCAKWSCNTGSVTNAPLSGTNQIICLGGSPSVPTINAGVVPGSKTQVCTNSDCTTTTSTNAIGYGLSTWWEPAIPSPFTNCGTFTFTAKAKGISQDSDCTNDTPTVTVGKLTVKVVNVGVLTIVGSPLINLCSNSANTIQVCASNSCGNLTWSMTPTITNGATISGSGSCATVNMGQVGGNYTVTAKSSENTNCANSIGLGISRDCDCTHHNPGPWVEITGFITPCYATQAPPIVYFAHTNKCGQITSLNCDGSIHLINDGVTVGHCPYPDTRVKAWYQECANDEVLMGTHFRVVGTTNNTDTNYVGRGKDQIWQCGWQYTTNWCYWQNPPDVNSTNNWTPRNCDTWEVP